MTVSQNNVDYPQTALGCRDRFLLYDINILYEVLVKIEDWRNSLTIKFFKLVLQQAEILTFLLYKHDIFKSERTLKRVFSQLGL